jgi:hypothetical protein
MKTTYTSIFRSIITCTIVVLLAVMPFMPNRALSDDTQTNDDRPTVALVNRVVEIVERRAPAIDWRQAKNRRPLELGRYDQDGTGIILARPLL